MTKMTKVLFYESLNTSVVIMTVTLNYFVFIFLSLPLKFDESDACVFRLPPFIFFVQVFV